MDATEMPEKPRWRRKRWWAVGLLGFTLAYPSSYGGLAYCAGREALPESVGRSVAAFYLPLIRLTEAVPPLEAVLEPYVTWCYELGERHYGKSAEGAALPAGTTLPQATMSDGLPPPESEN